MRYKFIGTFIILIFFVETIFINPNIYSITSKDSQITENPFEVLPPQDPNELLTNAPKAFTENRGQLENDNVRFYIQGGGLWFTDDGVWFEIREEIKVTSREVGVESHESGIPFDPMAKLEPPEPKKFKRVILKQEFVGANPVKPIGRERLGWNCNFFYGNDSSKWCTEVPNYQEVYYENLYDGIDLRYYTNERGLKYDFIVHPGANFSQIRVKYDGAERLKIDDLGNLVIRTKLEDIVDGELFIYQDYDGIRHQVNGRFEMYNNLEYGFEILDDYNEQEIIVIDPLVYSTFIGGIYDDHGSGITIDTNSNVYLTGHTGSTNFPNTTGAVNTKYNGLIDAFILKLNSKGSSLLYSTFIGGIKYDESTDIVIDSNNNAYITGRTNSTDFPITNGVYDFTYNNDFDVYVLKLNSIGSSLLYSTFVGGNSFDWGKDITIDSNGNIYVTGYTSSKDFPNTLGAYDTTYNEGFWGDIFVLKLNQIGSFLIYSTFIGGRNCDFGERIVVDTKGNVFVTGRTNSTDFPTTLKAYDTTYNGKYDVFVFKLNQTGSSLLYSTFLGGSNNDFDGGITIDSNGNAYVTGSTDSINFPFTTGVYDMTHNGGYDIFVIKLNRIGSTLLYSTFIGGSNNDLSMEIAIDSNDNPYITGNTFSPNFPNTTEAYDNKFNGVVDGIIFKINPIGSSLIYSSFIGGNDSGWEGTVKLVIDFNCNIYIIGATDSIDFPTTFGVYDNTLNGQEDIFVSKLSIIKNESFPSVEDLKISGLKVFRTNQIYLYSNSSDIEDLEKNLTPFFIEYRDPNYLFWNNSYFSKPQYNNSRWEISFTPPKNSVLGLYDFRIMFNDTDLLFSPWFYLNDSLTVLNNIPVVENLIVSDNKALLDEKILIWINGTDIEELEKNLTIEFEYRDYNEKSWNSSYLDYPIYSTDKWEYSFNIPFDAPFGYYDFRTRFNDSDNGFSQWLYANDSLLVYNMRPKVIDVKLSNDSVYRTNSVFLYVNGTDHETHQSILKLFAQYKPYYDSDWLDLSGEYLNSNNYWKIEFNTVKESTLGLYDFRVRFEDNESISSGWQYLNDSLEVLNNIPIVVDLNVSEYNVFRTETVILYVNGSDIENFEELLTCEIQYKSPSGTWIPLNGTIFKSDHWENDFTPPIDAELGIYDLRVNFTDLDKGYSGWAVIENVIEVKNNLPIISTLCDDFEVDFQPKYIELTRSGSDIEDSNIDLIWSVDQTTINTSLFSVNIINILEDIIQIVPKDNVSGSDDITLILTDKDKGLAIKSNVTIYINSIISYYYKINVTVFPKSVEIFHGQSQNVTLRITNKGNLSDNNTITFESGDFTKQDILFEKNLIILNPGEYEYVNVTITGLKNMKIDDYRITFIVQSQYAIDQTVLTIKVKRTDVKEKDKDIMLFAGIWIIIIIIIILMVVSGFYYYRKKYAKKELTQTEVIPIKSAVVPNLNKTIQKDSVAITSKQPTVITKEVSNTQQLQPSTIPTPTLAKPTQIHQTSVQQQIPQVTKR